MHGKMEKETLVKLVDVIIDRDNQVKIETLSDELTISQVVKFFERQGRTFTKTMIQNYIRVGVLPPPIEKRYYTKNHLVLLTLIDNLKGIYSLEEISTVLEPIRNNPEIFEDDVIKTTDVYKNYLEIRKGELNKWKESLPILFDIIDIRLKQNGVTEPEINRASVFMLALTMMAEAIALKDLSNEILNRYIKET